MINDINNYIIIKNLYVENYQDLKNNIYIIILNFMTNYKYQTEQNIVIIIDSINISNLVNELLKKYVQQDFSNLHIKYSEFVCCSI